MNYYTQLFFLDNAPDFTSETIEGNVSYHRKKYTLIRKKGIKKSYDSLGVHIEDVKNRIEATLHLKNYFDKYKSNNLELRNHDSWTGDAGGGKQPSMLLLYHLVNYWMIDNQIPYVGFGDFTDFVCGVGKECKIRLPISIKKKQLYIYSDSKEKLAYISRYQGLLEDKDAFLMVGFFKG